MNELMTIRNFNGAEIRTLDKEGETWWVARDVCEIIELVNITEALRGLDEDDLTYESLKSGGQRREMRLVNEPGLYQLIFKSQKPEAKQFKRWVTREVLPAIRRNGAYRMEPPRLEMPSKADENYMTASGYIRRKGLRLAAVGLGRSAAQYCAAMGYSTGRITNGGAAIYPERVLDAVSARHMEAGFQAALGDPD